MSRTGIRRATPPNTNMRISRKYIVDEQGNPGEVIISYTDFLKIGEISAEEDDPIIQLMVKAGLVRPRRLKKLPPPDPVSEEERRKLAEKLGQAPGRLLSEIIISERNY